MPSRSQLAWMTRLLFAATLIAACSLGSSETPAPVNLDPTSPPPAATAETGAPALSAASDGDVIFHNGVLLTMDDSRPSASAIHIVGDTIAAVGEEAAILAQAGPATVVIDLEGRTMMPGLVDAHSHMFERQDFDAVQDTLLRIGITTTAELYTDRPLLERLKGLAASGRLRVRLSTYLVYNTNCGEPLDEWWRAYPPTRVRGEMLRIGGIKIFSDGGSCNAPAVTYEYADGAGRGDLYFTRPELEAVLRSVDGAGYQAAVHALGDRALEVVLGSFESLWGGSNPRRHRIEHNAVIRPDQLARYTAAQPVATIFAPFATCHQTRGTTRYRYDVPELQRDWEWRWRDLLGTNPTVHFAWHGDMPGIYPPDAAYQLWAMVTRAELADDGTICAPPDWVAYNALTVDEVLHLMTLGAAYALDRDQEVASLVAGKLADLILLSDNPKTMAPMALRNLQVLMTMVGGKVEHCADGLQALCPQSAQAPPASAPPAGASAFRDEFESILEPGWTWTNEDPSAWSLDQTPGWLRIQLAQGGYLTTTPANVLLRPAPAGDFNLTTSLRASPTRNFEFAGLIVTFADGRVLQFGRAHCDLPGVCTGGGYYFDNLKDGASAGSNLALPGLAGSQSILRLEKRGTTYTAYYLMVDGQAVAVGSHSVADAPQSVGLLAAQAPAPGPLAEFDFFEITTP